jgi:asparagine synthase (glutamine-hydrolysing)
MSGLAAVFHRDGRPATEAAIGSMLAAAPYRGPEGLSARCFDAVALGCARMVVTPEDAGAEQPLVSPRTGCAIIADIRLDNREELLRQLPDHPSPAISDAEIVLRAYEVWGSATWSRLLGDFAFVLWDPRHQRLICGRDTSGQRMLFYRVDQRTFAAASEIQQLLQDSAVPVTPNEERLRDYLVQIKLQGNERDHQDTFFAGISALPAGHMLTVDHDNIGLRRYWELAPPAELRYRSEDEYAEHFLALFAEVVRSRLRTAHPVGALLSGGLDSSSIVCLAQELYRTGRAEQRGFVTFSRVYAGLECDERGFIDDVRTKYGLDARTVPFAQSLGLLQLSPAGFLEAPNVGVGDRNGALLQAVSEAGVRVLLTGEIADACIGGSRLVFDSLLRHGKLRALGAHFAAYHRLSDASLRRTIALTCALPLLPMGWQKQINARYIRQAFSRNRDALLPSWLQPRLQEDLCGRTLRYALALAGDQRFASPAREAEYRLLYPPEVARFPAPWPLAIVRPFADRRLHEFLLAIPPEQKFAPHPETDDFYAGSKRILRQAMCGILPESIRTRTTKTVFSEQFTGELRSQWAAYEAAFGPAAIPEIAARGYVEQGAFWTRLERLRAGAGGADLLYVMNAVTLESWLRALRLPRPALVTVAPGAFTRSLIVAGSHSREEQISAA